MSDAQEQRATEESVHDRRSAAGRGRGRSSGAWPEGPFGGSVLTVRAHSGLSGDIFLAGLLRMTETDEEALNSLLASILPELSGSVRLVRREVNHVGGWHAEVTLPHQHEHRTLADIAALIAASGLSESAKRLSTAAFTLLAGAEAAVHGKKPEEVHFHEVGALDSILDICASCELFAPCSRAFCGQPSSPGGRRGDLRPRRPARSRPGRAGTAGGGACPALRGTRGDGDAHRSGSGQDPGGGIRPLARHAGGTTGVGLRHAHFCRCAQRRDVRLGRGGSGLTTGVGPAAALLQERKTV